jgi:hypothetical protein
MRKDPGFFFLGCIAIGIFLIAFFSVVYLLAISADIATASLVSSASPLAGLWEIDTPSECTIISKNRQDRAWRYKDTCYDGYERDLACDMFYKRRIPFSVLSNASCPFGSDACLFTNQSAFEVTTHLLDSNVLGVNAPASKRFHFRRTMTCAPLQMDERYISSTGGKKHPDEWLYNYGPFIIGNFIWDNYTYRSPREWNMFNILGYTLA